jgi:ketosteroid isomerase-like protein
VAHLAGALERVRVRGRGAHRGGRSGSVVLHIRGRAKGSGIEVERRQAEVYTLRDGRIVDWKLYSDPSEARREAASP